MKPIEVKVTRRQIMGKAYISKDLYFAVPTDGKFWAEHAEKEAWALWEIAVGKAIRKSRPTPKA